MNKEEFLEKFGDMTVREICVQSEKTDKAFNEFFESLKKLAK